MRGAAAVVVVAGRPRRFDGWSLLQAALLDARDDGPLWPAVDGVLPQSRGDQLSWREVVICWMGEEQLSRDVEGRGNLVKQVINDHFEAMERLHRSPRDLAEAAGLPHTADELAAILSIGPDDPLIATIGVPDGRERDTKRG